MSGKSRTDAERAAMRLKCDALARRYRGQDNEEVQAMVSRILVGRVAEAKPVPESQDQAESPTKAELRAAEKARERHRERFGR
jgi:hypothetical protein